MKVKVYIGVIGSGKDYNAKKDCDIQLAFADQLREDVWTMLGWRPKTEKEYEAFKKTLFSPFRREGNILPATLGFTGRELLQRYGTEVRRKENPNHWIDVLMAKLWNEVPVSSTVGITDCRFPNEVKGLINGVEQLNKMCSKDTEFIELEFIHTNFKSDRYVIDDSHESEKLAIECLQFWGDDEAFQKHIRSL